ncbi:MAG: LLM class F420-dependent oxidoreductase [Chloroflexota bacterium]
MEIGVRLPAAGTNATPANLVKVARWAQELGYHAGWVSDHIILPTQVDSWYPYASDHHWPHPANSSWTDPLLALAWAGAVAPDIGLGTSVLVLPLRHPVALAKQVASLDRLSGGRVLLGVGAGWMKEEFDQLGVPFEGRGSWSAEMVRLMRRLWTGDIVDFDGKHWQVVSASMHPTPVRGAVPILWGGHTEAAFRRIAGLGDGWHPTQISMGELIAGIVRLRELCEEQNRDPASLLIVARPGTRYPLNAETLAQQRDLGVKQVVIDPPIADSELADCHDEMQRVAEMCGLRRRET